MKIRVKKTEVWEYETDLEVPDDADDDKVEELAEELDDDAWTDLGGDISYEVVG